MGGVRAAYLRYCGARIECVEFFKAKRSIFPARLPLSSSSSVGQKSQEIHSFFLYTFPPFPPSSSVGQKLQEMYLVLFLRIIFTPSGALFYILPLFCDLTAAYIAVWSIYLNAPSVPARISDPHHFQADARQRSGAAYAA